MRAQYMALTTYKLSDVWSGIGQAHTSTVHGTDLMEHVYTYVVDKIIRAQSNSNYNKEVTSPRYKKLVRLWTGS